MQRNRLLNIVFYLLVAAAGLVVLVTYGTSLPKTPFAPVAFEGPTALDSDGTLTAVADSDSRRLLLLDSRDRLVSVIEYDSMSTPIEVITDVCVSNATVYVAGLKYQKDSDFITRERVLAYDSHGAFKQVVYEVTPLLGYAPSVKSLHATPEGFSIGVARSVYGIGNASQSLQFYEFKGGGSKTFSKAGLVEGVVYDGGYSALADAYVISTDLGTLEGTFDTTDGQSYAHHAFSAVDMGDDGRAYVCDETTGSISAISPDGSVEEIVVGGGFTEVALNGRSLSYCKRSEGEIGLSFDGGETIRRLRETSPTGGLSALILLIVVCRVFLGLCLLAFVAYRLVVAVRSGDTSGIGAFFGSVAVVVAMSIAIGYSSYTSYQELVNTRLKTIDAFAEYLAMSLGGLSEDAERCANRGIFRFGDDSDDDEVFKVAESYERLVSPVDTLVYATTSNGIGTYACVYAQDDDGVFYLYDSTQEHIFGAALVSQNEPAIDKAFDPEVSTPTDLQEGSTGKDRTQYRLVPIASSDGKDVKVVIEVGSRMKSFEASVLSSMSERLAALLVMIAVVYLTYAELRGCGRSLIDYRAYLGKDDRDALALLTRPFTFGITALSSIDSVMTVLIARQLATSYEANMVGVMTAIPSVMLGVGLALGHILYGHVGSRYSPRKLGMRGLFVLLASSGLAIYSIVRGSLVLYCLAKLVLSVPLGTLYSFGYSLPRRADSKEVRGPAQEGVTRTDTSAAAIGTVLGGYAAEMLGTAWVYVLVILAAVLMMAFVRYVFPKHMAPVERPHVRSLRQTLGFLGSKSILPTIAFVMFPVVLAGGYDSFMFPLFSSDLGLSTSAIHNISAFGKLIVYVLIGEIGRTSDKLDKWAAAPVSVALIGATFLVFSLNSTLTWAIAVVALVAVLSKSSDGWKALWLRSAKQRSFPRGRATGMMFATRSLMLMAQPLVLTALLSASERAAVIVLGVVCVAGAVAFFATTRDSELVPEGWEPPEPPVIFGEE